MPHGAGDLRMASDHEPWTWVLQDATLTHPDLLVIGAPRCGTTSMYDALAQHPAVHMSPNKEPQFFAYAGLPRWRGPHDAQGVRDLETYRALFAEARADQRAGEASTLYLWSQQAAKAVQKVLPEDTQAIAMLRDPTLASWSRYIKGRANGIEDAPDIFAAFEAEATRRQEGWAPFCYYRELRDYGPQLERWFDALGPERVHVVLFDDYKADPVRTVRDVYRAVGIDDRFTPKMGVRYNTSGLPKDNVSARFLRSRNPVKGLARLLPARTRERLWLRLRNRSVAPQPCPPEVKQRLSRLFEPEIARTEEVLGVSLDAWRHQA